MRITTLALLAGTMTALASAPARATMMDPQDFHWWVQVSGGGTYITDTSFGAISSNSGVAVGGLEVGFSPGLLKNRIEFDLGYSGGTYGGSDYQTYNLWMQLHSLQLGVRYRQPLGDYFAVYGQAAAMLNFDVLSLGATDGSPMLGQAVATGGLLLNAGVEWYMFTWHGFNNAKVRLGLLLEAGYGFVSAANFDRVEATTSKGDLSVAPIEVGTLHGSGAEFRIGATVHF